MIITLKYYFNTIVSEKDQVIILSIRFENILNIQSPWIYYQTYAIYTVELTYHTLYTAPYGTMATYNLILEFNYILHAKKQN